VSFALAQPQAEPVTAPALPPLCVDMDGTLVRTDTLIETLCDLATTPAILSLLPALVRGKAAFKDAVARSARLDPKLLPYNETLLAWLRAEKARGRTLVLATASNRRIADAVADHLGLFDEVIASDATTNLRGAAKAQALVDRFGERGFVYAGNEADDLAIWQRAASCVAVNAPAGVVARLRQVATVERLIDDRDALLPGLLRAMRPHQWLKNVLVFVPILTAHALGQASAWIGGILMFAAFCCTASSIYLINDLLDLKADRAHPLKRKRPFASGAVPLRAGAIAAAGLLTAGLLLAAIGHVAWVIMVYALLSVSYSIGLKQLPLVDVFILAALYTIRLFGGGEATGHRLSLWLLGFSSFLFLSLALLKRVEEFSTVASTGGSKAARRGYTAADLPALQLFGVAAAFASSIVLALFVQSEATALAYASPTLLWLVVPLMLFWQCRMWLSGTRGYMHHDPIIYAAHDRVSWAIGGAVALVLVAAKSLPLLGG
jgi:4-hydroxybenzoate polyprenyltransferase/phosphoserine phosphatase